MDLFGIDETRFARALRDAGERQPEGIGMLEEKTLHAALKNYFSGENDLQEQKVGRYVADILGENGIIEVQTGSLYPLKKKIAAFLPEHPVTVVYPIMRCRKVFWIDPATREVTGGKKSPKKGAPCDALPELLYLSEFLGREGFRVALFFYDGEEYRVADGWGNGGKRGAHRFERIPTAAVDLLVIENRYDCGALLPENCPERFTGARFGQLVRMRGRTLWRALKTLEETGVVEKDKNCSPMEYRVVGKEFVIYE